MNSIQLFTEIMAGGLLLATFLMIGKVRLLPMLRYYALASLFLAVMGASVSYLKGESMFYLAPLATLIFKVILVPAIIYYTAKKIPSSNQLRMSFRPGATFVFFVGVLILSAIVVRNIPLDLTNGAVNGALFTQGLLFISVALILSGIMVMIVRRDLFSQVIGFLTMENGISAFGLVALEGLPLFLEMGVFLVIITSTMILAVLVDNVHKEYTVGDTSKLNELID